MPKAFKGGPSGPSALALVGSRALEYSPTGPYRGPTAPRGPPLGPHGVLSVSPGQVANTTAYAAGLASCCLASPRNACSGASLTSLPSPIPWPRIKRAIREKLLLANLEPKWHRIDKEDMLMTFVPNIYLNTQACQARFRYIFVYKYTHVFLVFHETRPHEHCHCIVLCPVQTTYSPTFRQITICCFVGRRLYQANTVNSMGR